MESGKNKKPSINRLIIFIKPVLFINAFVFLTLLLSVDFNVALMVFLRSTLLMMILGWMIYRYRFIQFIRFLKSMKCPELLVQILQFTYRYVHVCHHHMNQLRIAGRLRGAKMNDLKSAALNISHILILSYDQSERVYHAMILRGFNQR